MAMMMSMNDEEIKDVHLEVYSHSHRISEGSLVWGDVGIGVFHPGF